MGSLRLTPFMDEYLGASMETQQRFQNIVGVECRMGERWGGKECQVTSGDGEKSSWMPVEFTDFDGGIHEITRTVNYKVDPPEIGDCRFKINENTQERLLECDTEPDLGIMDPDNIPGSEPR